MEKSTLPPKFSERLRLVREKRELSQSELARLAGLQPSAVAHFEADRRKPSFDNIRGLAKALSVTSDYLLGSEAGTTAFRDEENLTHGDREFIQNMIDTMLKSKK
jgi:transcriptional regulator with XRE-family HTH domain